MAVRITFLSAFNAWSAAPEPRPPQPMRPILSVSLFVPAKRFPGKMAGAASTLPMAAEVLRNSRRVVTGFSFIIAEILTSVAGCRRDVKKGGIIQTLPLLGVWAGPPATSNIQHPTSNIEHPMLALRGFTGCWVFDVGCWMFSL